MYRSEYHTALCWTDPDTGLRACHRTTPYGAIPQECDLQTPGDPMGWQEVVVDEDAGRVIANAVGDVFITIRDTNIPGTCYTHTLVANGWGRLHINDNDELATAINNMNSWSFKANGDLEYADDGGRAKYNGHFKAQLGNKFPSGRLLSAAVNLH